MGFVAATIGSREKTVLSPCEGGFIQPWAKGPCPNDKSKGIIEQECKLIKSELKRQKRCEIYSGNREQMQL